MYAEMPRRSIDTTLVEHRSWWLNQREGLDLFWAAKGFDSSMWMRLADHDTRQNIYDTHLRAHTESRIQAIRSSKSSIEMIETISKLSSLENYNLPSKLNQIIHCQLCGVTGCGGPQAAHTCDQVNAKIEETGKSLDRRRDNSDAPRDPTKKGERSLKRLVRSRDLNLGVENRKLLFAHHVFDHIDILDTSDLNADLLAAHEVHWTDPTATITRAISGGQFTTFLSDLIKSDILPVLVSKDEPESYILTVGVFRLIESGPNPMPSWDSRDTPFHEISHNTFNKIVGFLDMTKPENRKPLRLAKYANDECSWVALNRDFGQHHCTDTRMQQYKLSQTQVAYQFSDLPTPVQLRIWLAIRDVHDGMHDKVTEAVLSWKVYRAPERQLTLTGAISEWSYRPTSYDVSRRAPRTASKKGLKGSPKPESGAESSTLPKSWKRRKILDAKEREEE